MSFGKRQIFLYQIYPAGQKYQENIFGQPTQQPTLLSHFLNPLQASNILLGIQGINGEAATDLLSLSTYFRTCRQFKRTDGDWAQITLSEILWESILKRSLSHQNAGPTLESTGEEFHIQHAFPVLFNITCYFLFYILSVSLLPNLHVKGINLQIPYST